MSSQPSVIDSYHSASVHKRREGVSKKKQVVPKRAAPETVGQTVLTSIQLPLAVCFPGLKACDVSSLGAE